MAGLTQESCVPCQGGVPTLTDREIADLLPQVAGWTVAEAGGVKRIQREFSFPDFRTAMAFTVQVGELAEREGHHPDIHLAWGKVRLTVWTHKIGGLSETDFIFAARCDALELATSS